MDEDEHLFPARVKALTGMMPTTEKVDRDVVRRAMEMLRCSD